MSTAKISNAEGTVYGHLTLLILRLCKKVHNEPVVTVLVYQISYKMQWLVHIMIGIQKVMGLILFKDSN